MTTTRTNRRDADRAAADRLDEELQFQLRSLEDLDAEHAAGGLSDRRYERLHAEYTARAAEIARAVEHRRPPSAARTAGPVADVRGARHAKERTGRARRDRPVPRRGGRRRLVAGLAVLALAGLGTTGTLGLLGGPGTSGTSASAAAASNAATVAALRRAVQQNPRDAAAHDALADALAQNGDLTGALREFDAAAAADPKDALALSYSGWIALLAGSPDKALDRLARAESADPGYPDAHAFRGIALLRAGGDRAEARAELERYLQLAPHGAMTQQVRDVLKQLAGRP